ncbi:phosphohydrolase [Paenibacillus selenitireducens]|uniref:Phosphohydrolase n=1 Tax=Paenibacillus selenitireducens TaxID=1324314 RepID=A0A1T2X1N4_9BACL|nr:HD domain-containing protein [Paenibacillus selenitireducens]OPA73780.1 phosphohydrolase [Paenibacillus selenitireducens]
MRKTKDEVIQLAEQFAKQYLEKDPSGHDWWHIHRVRQLALEIARRERADNYVCELAALLHDVADEKLNESKQKGLDKVHDWLMITEDDPSVIDQVMYIISNMSYNGGKNAPLATLEGQVVQDADRLDALGAIGIARTFAYSGWKGQLIYNPEIKENEDGHHSFDKTAIQHFEDKLFKLKDLMNTPYARELAESRHQFMEEYIRQFHKEWNGGHATP